MDAEWDKRVRDLFHAALDKPLDERRRFLHSACRDDPELLGEVESLLAHAEDPDITLDRAPRYEHSELDLEPQSDNETLSAGALLGHYRVLDKLGRGGMGEVFLARDAKLNREVALKTLPASVARDHDRLARFGREAQLLASLNHPNIGAIYSLERDGDTHFLVLELVRGETLAERISHGSLSLDTVLAIALQVVAALRAAHERGIVHRDLKPANVMVTRDGDAKVLDFGLAKALTVLGDAAPHVHTEQRAAQPSNVAHTQEGLALGTPPYMSPEQIRGQAVDERTDVWAFACLLYEMLTGQRAFGGGNLRDTFRAVLEQEPDWSLLPGDTPAALTELLQHCLQKRADDRVGSLKAIEGRLDEAASVTRIESPTNLPSQVTKFVGRSEDLAAIRRLIVRERVRLITVSGPSGIGKTRLAQEAGSRLRGLFADGVWFVPLSDLTEPAGVLTAITSTFSLNPQPGRDFQSILLDYLEAKELLLVLDNFEHVLDAAPLLRALLERAPRLHCLVSSQEDLYLEGEQVYDLDPLDVPSADTTDPAALSRCASVRLFVDRASRANRRFEFSRENASDVAQICRSLEGLPLALELAAARLREMPLDQIARHLTEHVEVLTSRRRDLAPRHRSLRASLEWSYGLLSPAERELFAKLSIFAGGFFEDAAEIVLSRPDVGQALGSLTSKSLLTTGEVLNETRYRMLRPIHEFAREKLGDAASLRAAHAHHYLQLAQSLDHRVGGPEQNDVIARMALELDNFRQAMDHARAHGDGELLGALSFALVELLHVRGLWPEGILRLEQAEEALRHSDDALLLANVVRARAGLLMLVGDLESARRDATRSLELARELDNENVLALSLLLLGVAAKIQGAFDEARAHIDESLSLFRALGETRRIAQGLLIYADLLCQRGEYEESRQAATEGLEFSREAGDRRGMAGTLNMLGVLAGRQGDYEQSESLIEQALAIHRESGDRVQLAQALNNLGGMAFERGAHERAGVLLRESYELRREVGDKRGMGQSLYNLGLVAKKQDALDEARSAFDQSLEIHRQLDSQSDMAETLRELGELDRMAGDHQTARRRVGDSLAIARRIGHSSGLAESLCQLGKVAAAEGESSRGALFTLASVRVSERSGDSSSREAADARAFLSELREKLDEEEWAQIESELERRGLDGVIDEAI